MNTFLGERPGLIELDPSIPRPVVLADRVYAALKHRILTCALKPGVALVEAELCAALHVSRTPLREALNRLAHEGLVQSSPYRGYAVAALNSDKFSDLCEVRRLIEPQAARLAAERATPEDVSNLLASSKLEYIQGDRPSYENYLRANSVFHLGIARCARNSQLESIVVAVLDRHQRPCYLGLDIGIDAAESTVEHVAVVMAIRERDGAKACDLMTKHIAAGERRILAALKAAGY